jgi:hypothetical protein
LRIRPYNCPGHLLGRGQRQRGSHEQSCWGKVCTNVLEIEVNKKRPSFSPIGIGGD